MHLSKLVVRQLRNLKEIALDFDPGINAFVGENGQGKTNCLEAISLAASLRSLQGLQNGDLIFNGSSESYVSGSFRDESDFLVEVSISPKGKKGQLEHKPIAKFEKLLERIFAVSFIPADLQIMNSGAQFRRKAVDQLAFGLFPTHADFCKRYEKILSSRNQILKSEPLRNDLLEIYSNMLVEVGVQIVLSRLEAIRLFYPAFLQSLDHIFSEGQSYALSYEAGWCDTETISADPDLLTDQLRRALSNNRPAERARRMTLCGPHLDDVHFYMNGLEAKKLMSRGQARVFVLAFKLAHMQTVFAQRGRAPILLLDDIVSELDEKRTNTLLEVIWHMDTQVFMTSVEQAHFQKIKPDRLFLVKQGAVHLLTI